MGAGNGGGGGGGGGYGGGRREAQQENMHPLLQTFVQHFLQHDLEQGRGLLLKTLLTEMIAKRISLSIWLLKKLQIDKVVKLNQIKNVKMPNLQSFYPQLLDMKW